MGAVISCRRTRYCVGAGCGEVQIWTPEGNRPGGQLTRHRQQLDQVADFVRTKSGDAMRNLGSNPP